MNKTNTMGIDLAKNVFHLCTQDAKGHILKKTKLGRQQFKYFLAITPPRRVVFESCATSHMTGVESQRVMVMTLN